MYTDFTVTVLDTKPTARFDLVNYAYVCVCYNYNNMRQQYYSALANSLLSKCSCCSLTGHFSLS